MAESVPAVEVMESYSLTDLAVGAVNALSGGGTLITL